MPAAKPKTVCLADGAGDTAAGNACRPALNCAAWFATLTPLQRSRRDAIETGT
jgi:hypothetical protein